MLSKKVERILKCFMVFALALSTLNFVYAEDTLNGFDMNNITFDVKGHIVENDNEKSKVDITINMENKSEEELTLDSIKSNFSDAVEYDKNSETSFVEEDHQIVLNNQTISAHDNISYSYTIFLSKDKSFDKMTWSINDKEVKSISSIDEILSEEDIEKLNQEEEKQTTDQDTNDKFTNKKQLKQNKAKEMNLTTLPDGYSPDYGMLDWKHPSASLPFGSATGTSVFTFSDLEFKIGAELCGKIAVGGNLVVENSMSNLGFVPAAVGNGDELPYTKDQIRYIVKGNAEGKIANVNGWIAVGGDSSKLDASISLADGGSHLLNTANGLKTTKEVVKGTDVVDSGETVVSKLNDYFSTAKTDLSNLNSNLFSMPENGSIDKSGLEWGKLSLNGTSQYNIFNVNIEDLNKTKDIYINIPQNARVQINVIGDSTHTSFNHGINSYYSTVVDGTSSKQINNNTSTDMRYSENILWNFDSHITNIEVKTVMIGSILAPNATLVVGGSSGELGCSTNGTVIVNKYIMNSSGGEAHNYPFSFPIGDTIKISGKKIWDDNNNPNRPTEITLQIKDKNNNEVLEEITLSAGDDHIWDDKELSFESKELPQYSNGVEIEYEVIEKDVTGYEVGYSKNEKDGFVITNKLQTTPEKETRDISGTKTWSGDHDNADKTRPESITVNLLANGDKVKSVEVKPDADGNWKYSFAGLDKYDENGTLINYTVTENSVKDYKEKITGFNIENTFTGKVTRDISGTKTWKNVPEGSKYPTVTIELYQDGKKVDDTKIENGGTSYSFTGLAKYAADGHEYKYTVKEVKIDGYQSEQNGYDFVNTYIPDTPTITTRVSLIIYKVDQDHNFLEGADFQLVKEDGTIIHPIKGKARFEFNNLTDGNYKVIETVTPEGYEGIGEFNIVISNGLITCPEYDINDPFETLTVENTNDGDKPEVFGDEIDEEDYEDWELGEEVDDTVKTSDDQNMMGYTGLSLISAVLFFFLRRKVKHF